ncbi:MAG: cytochrome c oxidase subunit II [Planctomycetota bacterium]
MDQSMTTPAQYENSSFWMPAPASTFAEGVDWLFYFILIVSAVFFILILIAMAFFVMRYRRREGHSAEITASHSTALELTWTIIPSILVLMMFYYGFKTFIDMYTFPENSKQVYVTSWRWAWAFEHPETGIIETDQVLTVPVDTPIELVLASEDVIHSFFVPAFRIKKDAVPGRFNKTWFQATEPGEYDFYCTEYCGTGHSQMFGKVVVLDQADYDLWVQEKSVDIIDTLEDEARDDYFSLAFDEWQEKWGEKYSEIVEPAWQRGERAYKGKGCAQCHTIDGSVLIGPSFKGIWGETHNVVVNGQTQTVEVDENYFLESIRDPGAKIVAGYDNVMQSYSEKRLSLNDVRALIEYVKTLD